MSKKAPIYTLTPFVCALLADPREGLHLAPEPDQLPEQLQNTIESALRRGARADERGLFPQKMDAYISVPPSPAVAGAVANPLPPRQQLHRWRRRHRRYYRLWRVEHFSGLFIIEKLALVDKLGILRHKSCSAHATRGRRRRECQSRRQRALRQRVLLLK